MFLNFWNNIHILKISKSPISFYWLSCLHTLWILTHQYEILQDIWFEIGRRIFFNATNTFCHCYKLLIYNLKSWNISSFNFFFIISILPIPKKKKLFDMKSDVKLNSKELKFVKIVIIQGSLFSVHNCDSLLKSC